MRFLIGDAESTNAASDLVQRARGLDLDAVMGEIRQRWTDVTATLQVETPDSATNLLLNHWLLYQVLSCRMWARTAYYQASGAYGFRDQLQDVMALCIACPGIAREHLLRAASRQFIEGDVQHWWLPPGGKGLRSRMTDDRLWLPYSVLHYLEVTGEVEVLEASVPFHRESGDGRRRLGRSVVPARLLRRWDAVGQCQPEGVPHRLDRAILGRHVGRWRSGPGPFGHACHRP
ncbi:hypothetical protein INQ42_06530 [Lysobacter avium]|uniref:Glycosyl hydrolase 94 catalytic domain-containing protein n=1 Tax=Novilysobacter avium TaxID=2781023 RepID=A0A7S6UIN2_9GAMM|nr:hypothetical protein INQ42_06530 [Lysobacter avium]